MASGGGAGGNSGDYVQMFIDYALRNNQDPVAAVDSMTIVHIKGEIGEFQGIGPGQYKTKVAFKQAVFDRLAGNPGAINEQKEAEIQAVEPNASARSVLPGISSAAIAGDLTDQEELAPPAEPGAVEIIDSLTPAAVVSDIEGLPRVTVVDSSVLDAAPESSETNAVELQIVGEVSNAPIPADAERVTAEITAGAPAKPTDIADPTYRQRFVAWAQAMKGWLINYIRGTPGNTMLTRIRETPNLEYDQTFIYKHPLLQNIMSILPSDHEVYKRARDAFEAGQAAQLALYDMLVVYVDLEKMYEEIGVNYKARRNTTDKISGIKGIECALLFKYIMYVYLLRIKQEKRRMFEYIYFVRLTMKQRQTISAVKRSILDRVMLRKAQYNIASQPTETTSPFGLPVLKSERGMTAITSRELIGINAIVNEILNDDEYSCNDPSKPASTAPIKNRIKAIFTPIREGGVPTIQVGKMLEASTLFAELDGLKIRELPIIGVKKDDQPLLKRIAYTTTLVTLGAVGFPSYAVSYAVKTGREAISTARGQIVEGAEEALQRPVVAAGADTGKAIASASIATGKAIGQVASRVPNITARTIAASKQALGGVGTAVRTAAPYASRGLSMANRALGATIGVPSGLLGKRGREPEVYRRRVNRNAPKEEEDEEEEPLGPSGGGAGGDEEMPGPGQEGGYRRRTRRAKRYHTRKAKKAKTKAKRSTVHRKRRLTRRS